MKSSNRSRLVALFAVAALWIASCAQEITIDLPETDPSFVAISHFEPNKPFFVRVTQSQPVSSNGNEVEVPDPLDVSISTGGMFLDKLRKVTINGKTYWESRDIVEPGVEYSLAVRKPGFQTVTATSSAPEHIELEPIEVDLEQIEKITLPDGTVANRMTIRLQPEVLPEQGRYFAFNVRHEIEHIVYQGETPVLLDSTSVVESFFFTDGRTASLIYNTPEPVILVDEQFWGASDQFLELDVVIPFDPQYQVPKRVMVEWRTLSRDFYRYHLSLARQNASSPFNNPDALYNNIEGGFGSFSGFSVSTDTVLILR